MGDRGVGRARAPRGPRAPRWWPPATRPASSICSAVSPGGEAQVAGAGRPGSVSVRSTRGIGPWRLITSQATSTRRTSAGSSGPASVVASRRRSRARAPERQCRTVPAPRRPCPGPSRATPMRQSSEDPEGQDDLEPPPPDSQCHPGVGVEGPDVAALRHRAGGGTARGARARVTRSTTMPKWASTKPTSTSATTMSASTMRDEACHQSRGGL